MYYNRACNIHQGPGEKAALPMRLFDAPICHVAIEVFKDATTTTRIALELTSCVYGLSRAKPGSFL